MPFKLNELDDSSSSNSSLDTTVSRMIADENIIDSFFYICDVERQGTVAVSKLIEFIVNTTDSNIQVGLSKAIKFKKKFFVGKKILYRKKNSAFSIIRVL